MAGYRPSSFWEVRWGRFYLIQCRSPGFGGPVAPACLLENVAGGSCLAPSTEGDVSWSNTVTLHWCPCKGTGLSPDQPPSCSLPMDEKVFAVSAPATLTIAFCKVNPPWFSRISYPRRRTPGLFPLWDAAAFLQGVCYGGFCTATTAQCSCFDSWRGKMLLRKVFQTLWTTSFAAVGVKPWGNLAHLFGHFCINTFTSKQY